MTIEDKLNAIKELLGFKGSAAPVEPTVTAATTEPVVDDKEYSQATATDGTIVKWEGELETGKDLMFITPEGDKPAPDGNVQFEDGTVVTTVAGKVTAITPAATMTTEPTMAEQMSAIIEPLKAEIEALKTALSAYEKTSTEQLHKFETNLSDTVKVVEELAKAPATETPKPIIPAAFMAVDKTSRVEQIAAQLKAIRNNK